MTQAQLVHLKLMSELRDCIRTHECRIQPQANGFRYSKPERQYLKRRLAACIARGMTRSEAAIQCGTTQKTVTRLLGRVR